MIERDISDFLSLTLKIAHDYVIGVNQNTNYQIHLGMKSQKILMIILIFP